MPFFLGVIGVGLAYLAVWWFMTHGVVAVVVIGGLVIWCGLIAWDSRTFDDQKAAYRRYWHKAVFEVSQRGSVLAQRRRRQQRADEKL